QAGLVRCQREAEEVTELMKQNFARALEREGRLQELDSRAQELRAMVGTAPAGTRGDTGGTRGGHRAPG
ncbi:VAMP5 protein, partial [Todus mexicanus]|nr:VAMP5 protein [Todus mexicanus]